MAEIDLSGARLVGANFSGAHLHGADFSNANLRNAIFNEATLNLANFFQARMDGTRFKGAIAMRANFIGVNLENAQIDNAIFSQAHFGYAHLYRASIERSELLGANFTNATIRGTLISGNRISGANFTDFNDDDDLPVLGHATDFSLNCIGDAADDWPESVLLSPGVFLQINDDGNTEFYSNVFEGFIRLKGIESMGKYAELPIGLSSSLNFENCETMGFKQPIRHRHQD